MPITDPFFISNSYDDFLKWMESINRDLIDLNIYTPSNAGEKVGREQRENAKKSKELANKSRLISMATITADITKSNVLQKGNEILSKRVVDYNSSVLKSTIEKYAKDVNEIKNTYVSKSYHKYNEIVLKELSTRSDIPVEDLGNSGNIDKNATHHAKSFPDFADYDVIKNNHYVSPSERTFPKVGHEVTDTITNSMMNRYKYTFFTVDGQEYTEYKGWLKFPNHTSVENVSHTTLDILNKISPAVVDETKFFGTRNHEMSEYFKEILDEKRIVAPSGTYKFFIEKLHGRYYENGAATPYKLNPVTETQKSQYSANGYNFSNRKVFAAFLDNYNDQFRVESTPYNFIGRGEAVHMYSNTARTFTIEFTILTDHALEQLAAIDILNEKLKTGSTEDILSFLLSNEMVHHGNGTYQNDAKYRLNGATSTYFDTPETTWQKLTFIAQCCYPYYRNDGKMKEQPLVRIRIADFYDVVCIFSSVDIQLNPLEVPYIDFNNSSLGEQPIGFKVTIQANIIHDYEPNSQFYGFYHRKQFDTLSPEESYNAKVWGIGLSKQSDMLSKILKKNSPLSIKDSMNMKNLNDLLSSTDFMEIQNDVNILKSNMNSLGNQTVNLFEEARKIRLKNIFNAIKSIKTQEDFFAALKDIKNKVSPTLTQALSVSGQVLQEKNKIENSISETKNKINTFTPSDIISDIVEEVRNISALPTPPKSIGDIGKGNI